MEPEIGSLFSPLRSSSGSSFFEAMTPMPGSSSSSPSMPDSSLFRPAENKKCQFVGIQNQGATCYLNSLIQAIHMTPEFRSALYSLTPKTLRFDPQSALSELRQKLDNEEQAEIKREETERDRARQNFEREIEIELAEAQNQRAAPPKKAPSKPELLSSDTSQDGADEVDVLHGEKGQFLSNMGFDRDKIVEVLTAHPSLPVQQLINLIVAHDALTETEEPPESVPQVRFSEANEEDGAAFGPSLFSDEDDGDSANNDKIDAPTDVLLEEDSPLRHKSDNPFGSDGFDFSADAVNTNFVGISGSRASEEDAAPAVAAAPADAATKRPIRKIPLALQRLFAQLQTTTLRSVSTTDLTQSFGWHGSQSYIQQDVHELNRVLFDAIEKSLNKTPVCDLISSLYRGTLQNEILCLECQTSSIREEHFLDLPLPLLNADSVQQSLANMVQYEKLDGSNQYHCSKCDKKVDALKGVTIKSLPPILILPLLRFEYQFTDAGFERSKNTKDFSFPLTLDMSPYTKPGSLNSTSTTSSSSSSSSSSSTITTDPEVINDDASDIDPKPSSSEQELHSPRSAAALNAARNEAVLLQPPSHPESDLLYDLFGIVIHKGSSAGFGHYTAYLRDVIPPGNDADPATYWYDFDDTTVTPISTSTLIKQFGGKSECAYMLIYRARTMASTVPHPQIPDYIKEEIQLESSMGQRRHARREQAFYSTQLEIFTPQDLSYSPDLQRLSALPLQSVQQKLDRLIPVDLRSSVAHFRHCLTTDHLSLLRLESPDQPFEISVLGSQQSYLYRESTLTRDDASLFDSGCTKTSKILIWNGQTIHGHAWEGNGPLIDLSIVHLRGFSTAPGEFPTTKYHLAIPETATVSQLRQAITDLLLPHAPELFQAEEADSTPAPTKDAPAEEDGEGSSGLLTSKKSDKGGPYMSILEGRNVTPLRDDATRRLFDCRFTPTSEITVEAPIERLDLSIAFSIAEHRRYSTEIFVFDKISATPNSEPLVFNIPDSLSVFNFKKLVLQKLGESSTASIEINTFQLRKTTIGDLPAEILSDESLSLAQSKVYNGARLLLEKGDSSRLRGLISIKVVVALDDQEPHPIHEVMASKSWSVVRLKTELLSEIGLDDDVGPFRVRRAKLDRHEKPQPDSHFSDAFAVLSNEGVYDGAYLWLERGRPKSRGEFKLTFSRYTYQPFNLLVDQQLDEEHLPAYLYSPSLHASVLKNTMLANFPSFLQYITELNINNAISLSQLKDIVLPSLKVALAEGSNPIDAETIEELGPEQIRVWAGERLLRRDAASLVNQRIQSDQPLTLEIVPESLPLMPRSILLYVHKRIPAERSFDPHPVEIMVDLECDNLRAIIASAFKIDDPSKICMISKLVSYSLSWRAILPDIHVQPANSNSTQTATSTDATPAAAANTDSLLPQVDDDLVADSFVETGKRRQLSDGTPLDVVQSVNTGNMFFLPLDADSGFDLLGEDNDPDLTAAILNSTLPPSSKADDANNTGAAAPQEASPTQQTVNSTESTSESKTKPADAKTEETKKSADSKTESANDTTKSTTDEWSCSACTLFNPQSVSFCTVCDMPRPSSKNQLTSPRSRRKAAISTRKTLAPTSRMAIRKPTSRLTQKSTSSQSRKRPMETASSRSISAYYVRDGDVISFKLLDDDPEFEDNFSTVPPNIGQIGLVSRKKSRAREFSGGLSGNSSSASSRREVGIQIQVDEFDESDSSSDEEHWEGQE